MEKKRYIIDIYAETNDDFLNQEIVLDGEIGELRCPDTGERFAATFIFKDLKLIGQDEELEEE